MTQEHKMNTLLKNFQQLQNTPYQKVQGNETAIERTPGGTMTAPKQCLLGGKQRIGCGISQLQLI